MRRPWLCCFLTLLLHGLVFSIFVWKFSKNVGAATWFPPQSTGENPNNSALPPGALEIGSLEVTGQTLHPEDIQWKSAQFFPRALNRTDYDRYIELLHQLSELFTRHNVTFVMCDGTLLGSYIGHDMLPWDDDMDVMVKYTDINKIKDIFSNASIWKEFEIHGYKDDINEYDYSLLTKRNLLINEGDLKPNQTQPRHHKFKFFYKNSPNAGNYAWKWPCIDVKYYLENQTHIWNLDKEVKTVPRGMFYPLHYRPFAGHWLPASHDTRGFLRNKYGRFHCSSPDYNHQKEVSLVPQNVSCSMLHSYYPFVRRDQSQGRVIESLMQDSRLIHAVFVKESLYASQQQFEI